MLHGLHIGDSLGATLEFGPPSKKWNSHTEIIGGGHFNWESGAPTDDTDLMIALLKSLYMVDGKVDINLETMCKNYVEWLDKEPSDVGMTTMMAISNLEMLTEYSDESIRKCGGTSEQTKSNGSLMRCAPLALMMPNGLDKVTTQTMSTHAHPLCILTDRIFINALSRLLWNSAEPSEIIETAIMQYNEYPEAKLYLEKYMDSPWEDLKTSGYILDTIGSALWALDKTDNFEDGLLHIVNRGDDSDTCGAVTGAVTGAYYGYNAIPERWTSKIRDGHIIADNIARIFNSDA